MMNRMKRDRMIYSRIRSTEAWKELEEEVNKSKDEDEAKSLIRQHVIEEDGFIDAKKVNTYKYPFPKIDYAVQITQEGEPIL